MKRPVAQSFLYNLAHQNLKPCKLGLEHCGADEEVGRWPCSAATTHLSLLWCKRLDNDKPTGSQG